MRDAGDLICDALRRLPWRPRACPAVRARAGRRRPGTRARPPRSLVRRARRRRADGGRPTRVHRAAVPRRGRRARGDRACRARPSSAARGHRCPPTVACAAALAARRLLGRQTPPGEGECRPTGRAGGGEVEFWRCANDRAQAQSVAADVERLIAREGVAPGAIAVIVPSSPREGQAVAVALEERAIAYRLVGEAAFFQRAEIRDLLAWLRLLAVPSDAGAVVRALARPPIELRAVDIRPVHADRAAPPAGHGRRALAAADQVAARCHARRRASGSACS